MKQQAYVLREGGPGLLIRRQQSGGSPVLYVHGATFPSALSVGYRFDGRSWMDDLAGNGHDAWAFDFLGYGGSDRHPDAPQDAPAVGRAGDAAAQIARVADHIARQTGHSAISIIAHSWGTIPAALFASREPARVKCLVLFGPIAQREGPPSAAPSQCWRTVSIAQQLARFVEDVPKDHPPVLIEPGLAQWGAAYLATDKDALTRDPPAVRIPNGPAADIGDAWSGRLAYRPEDVRVPALVVRGEWDSLANDADAAWLLSRIAHDRKQDVKVPKGTHLMHLERSREELFAAVNRFLRTMGNER
ncbi:MAG: alpha/beta hydrolase [Rhizomicrobium sp.]